MAIGVNWLSEAFWSKSGIEQRAARALRCVLDGELSAGRQALEGAELARGTREILDALKDRERRPPNLRDPLPDRVVEARSTHACVSGPRIVCTSVGEFEAGCGRSFRNDGRALASDIRECRKHRIVGFLCRHIRQGRSPTGNRGRHPHGTHDRVAEIGRWRERHCGWRSFPSVGVQNSGETIRPAGGRCHNPRFSTHSKHVLGVSVSRTFSTEIDPSTTVISVDGVGAFDSVSRAAMLSGLLDMEEGEQLFVRMFYSQPLSYFFDDEAGETHTVQQGEGGEQGDALMPVWGNNRHSERSQGSCRPANVSSRSWAICASLANLHELQRSTS